MPITDEQFNNYVDEADAAKQALGETASELLQTCVNLRSQNAILRKQIARFSQAQPPVPPTPSDVPPTPPTDENPTENPTEPTGDGSNDSKITESLDKPDVAPPIPEPKKGKKK